MAADSNNATDGVDLKVFAIQGGGDWTDASVEYMVIPKSADLAKLVAEYREYRIQHRTPYISLSKWLMENHGASEATNAHIEVIGDDW